MPVKPRILLGQADAVFAAEESAARYTNAIAVREYAESRMELFKDESIAHRNHYAQLLDQAKHKEADAALVYAVALQYAEELGME